MAEQKTAPGETTQFIQRMDPELLGWDQPKEHLREALDGEQFRLFAQPVVALAPPQAVIMAEVLVRLREEEESQILVPGDFLPAVEHFGMVAELDRWVVREALQRLREGGSLKKLSVNVSTQTIEDAGFAPFVAEQLRLAALEPSALVIEIDEFDVLDRREAVARFAAEMKGIGCQLLVDGFARRSMSFDAVKALQVDYVKVDGTLTRNILRSASAANKLKAMLRAGEAEGIAVIAECVEDARVLSALRLLKVAYAQGYGLHQPAPLAEVCSR